MKRTYSGSIFFSLSFFRNPNDIEPFNFIEPEIISE